MICRKKTLIQSLSGIDYLCANVLSRLYKYCADDLAVANVPRGVVSRAFFCSQLRPPPRGQFLLLDRRRVDVVFHVFSLA